MIAPRAIAASEPTASVTDRDSFVNMPGDIELPPTLKPRSN